MGDGGKRPIVRKNSTSNSFNDTVVVKNYDGVMRIVPQGKEYGARRIINPQLQYFNDFTRPKLEWIVADLVAMHLLPPHACLNDVFGKARHTVDKEFAARVTPLNEIEKTGDTDALIREFIGMIRFSAQDYLYSVKDQITEMVKGIERHSGKAYDKSIFDFNDGFFTLQYYGYKPLHGSQITTDDVRHVQRMPGVIIAALTDFLPEDTAEQLIAWRQEQAARTSLPQNQSPEANL